MSEDVHVKEAETRREGKRDGPCIHFNGHIDVVEVGGGWTVPPFEGLVKDGRVYGRPSPGLRTVARSNRRRLRRHRCAR